MPDGERRGAELRALRQILQALDLAADEHVAHVLALQETGNLQPVGQEGWHVLGGMNGEIDAAVVERLFQFLGEKALATSFRQRAILDTVAGRADHHDLERLFRKVVRGHQTGARFRCLSQSQSASARSNSHQIGLHEAMSVLTRILTFCG